MTDTHVDVNAHMPPQPTEVDETNPVFALKWNPETNEWAPSNEPVEPTLAERDWVAQPSHGDVMLARPMVNVPGHPETYDEGGVAPDPRANLLTDIRNPRRIAPPPVQVVHHVVETRDQQAQLCRARVVRVQAGGPASVTAATVLLESNPKRRRALFKVLTASSQILLSPIRQGGQISTTTPAAGNLAGYPLSPTDPVHEVKCGAGVEAVATNTAGSAFADVAIWEELDADVPGLV